MEPNHQLYFSTSHIIDPYNIAIVETNWISQSTVPIPRYPLHSGMSDPQSAVPRPRIYPAGMHPRPTQTLM